MELHIKETINDILQEKRITKKKASDTIGVTPQHYDYLLNSKNITVESLEKLAKSVGCKLHIYFE